MKAISSYFSYNGLYMSGGKYWTRKLLQWPLNLVLVGFYLRAVTTFGRAKSLQMSDIGAYVFSVYSVIIDLYLIFILPLNDKVLGVIPEMYYVFIFPVVPFMYLIFYPGADEPAT